MQMARRRCRACSKAVTEARSGEPAHDVSGSSEEEDFKKAVKRSRGHASDDESKRRRKQQQKQKKEEKRKAKREARNKRRHNQSGKSSTKSISSPPAHLSKSDTTATVSAELEEQQEHDSPRSEGEWLSTSPSPSPSPLSLTDSTTTDDSTELSSSLHASFPLTMSAPLSSFEDDHETPRHGLRSVESSSPKRRHGAVTMTSSLSREALRRLRRNDDGQRPIGGSSADVTAGVDHQAKLDFLAGVNIPASVSSIGAARLIHVRHVHMLYNPWSGNKKGERKMRKARRQLVRAGKEVTATKLLHKGHAEELCATMDFTGIDVLCSVGGDGTFHECINGLMRRINKQDGPNTPSENTEPEELHTEDKIPPLAFIAAGTGNSFVHELGCPRINHSVEHIIRGIDLGIDLCRITYGDQECYSFNSIHWGIGSRVVDTAERFRWMGNSARYIMAALVELVKGNHGRVRLIITDENDEEVVWDESYALGIANNIITAGKGMRMAPQAKIDDGLIDLLLFTSRAPKDLLAVLRKFYNGTHVNLPHVRYIKAKKFVVIPYKPANEEQRSGGHSSSEKDDPVVEDQHRESDSDDTDQESCADLFNDPSVEILREAIDIDGELKGFTPFTCEVLPRAIRVIL